MTIEQVVDAEADVPARAVQRLTLVAETQVGVVAGSDRVVVDVHTFHPVDVEDGVGDVALLQLDAVRADTVVQRRVRGQVGRAQRAGNVPGRAAQGRVRPFHYEARQHAQCQRFALPAEEVWLDAVADLGVDTAHPRGRHVQRHVEDASDEAGGRVA